MTSSVDVINQKKFSNLSIGLFYGTSTCYTEIVAEKIALQLSNCTYESINVDLYNILDEPISSMEAYDCLIMGIPTWDYGEIQEDWERIWNDIDKLDFNGKTVALYGLGDQIGYPDWFLDAMGYLWAKISAQGATTIGYWPTLGFDFNESKALTKDKKYFVGLAIDDANEFDLTDERISVWCNQIRKEFKSKSNIYKAIEA
ncbi:flavodoxin FldB [Porticoccus sp.]|jgi:flavodoxin II|nr:flavodoxin FldB [Porticoccus sp.]MDC0412000.1 flavodoxin FldB [Porticoccus sp.]MDC0888255.1 flavodoxin FldB [Porticoccus sp.]MDC1093471.1 flavodoxin FldB [Porticoccus sp.]MDC1270269.1 flavodoxin FldB [Porticoccus sp.]